MTNNITSAVGIFAAIVVALVISIAGGQSGMEIWGLPMLFVFGAAVFLIQWLAFVPAYIYQTEKYFDLIGSLTYISLAVIALILSNKDIGSIIIALMVLIWAMRLGSFLFVRVQKVGHDSRFTKIKPDFLQYLMTWTLQGLWVFLTFAAGLTALTAGKSHPVDFFVIAGSLLWIIGFSIEVIADGQKSTFRSDAANKGKFIQHGLWARSRHPNYFGEILLWTGVAITAIPVLEGLQYVTLISPVFVFILLTKISGVRMLEHQARRRWGDDPEYNAYHARTPVLWLNPFPIGKS
ncbi:MAG: steroid 5-alpha reductase family enzyme [Candidatus Azotimanducaceae bacterium]|jgi:steroid 5-alpha reductase family enzyme